MKFLLSYNFFDICCSGDIIDGRRLLSHNINQSKITSLDSFRLLSVHLSTTRTIVASPQGLYLFGGWNGKRALNDLHVLDVASGTWSEA